jgi:hypothetical protein
MNSDDEADRQLLLTTRRQNSSLGSGGDDTQAVLTQADALMRRHRVFVAGAEVANPADDLPVLTEVVEDPDFGNKRSAGQLRELRAYQHAAISAALDKWLETELPIAIQSLTDDLAASLKSRAKTELLERVMKELDSSNPR